MIKSYEGDPYFTKILKTKIEDSNSFQDYTVTKGQLRCKGRVAVGCDEALRSPLSMEVIPV